MAGLLENLSRITDSHVSDETRRYAIRDFTDRLHWTPSYELTAPIESAGAYNHVVVEHGLSNSAVISFLRGNSRASDLTPHQLRSLLSISYNNMIEWHYFVSQHDARRIFNLVDPTSPNATDETHLTSAMGIEAFLSSSSFTLANAARRVKPQERPCDDALIAVVSRWKRMLAAEVTGVSIKSLSTLFNAIMFIRGCEDRNLRESLQRGNGLLLRGVWNSSGFTVSIPDLIRSSFAATGVVGNIEEYIDFAALEPFAQLDKATAENLTRDFYDPKDAPYSFNFALMSKHALSRIYERFVTLIVEDETAADQLAFLPRPHVEAPTKKSGSVYTPQFIASFFARYIRENTTPRRFRELRSFDPACGSGIFLRTVLEEQCNPLDPAISTTIISDMFSRIKGIDKDGNALEATKLSLALLHLVSTDRLPPGLNLVEGDAIALAHRGDLPNSSFDAVLTNPPYIKLDHLNEQSRPIYLDYLGEDFRGRIDAYIPFLKLCLSQVSDDGFACLVIPQTFLQARNSQLLRGRIASEFDVRCLVDLSAVDVFDGVGVYSILLILQRKAGDAALQPSALVAQATEFVGSALQAVLDGREARTPYYRVFRIEQEFFAGPEWVVRPPEVIDFDRRLQSLPRLSDYLECFQGFVTGADDVFIRRKSDIPPDERAIYMDYLPDRRIGRFSLPFSVDEMVFYPYLDDELLDQEQLQNMFPQTWGYLIGNRLKLEARRRSSSTPWWKPERPRDPARMRRQKIVCPHLMLTPRFAIDQKGRFATKHGPVMITKVRGDDELLLKFFCGVLNSSVSGWYIRTHVPAYSRGYSRLEPATLKSMPVPPLEQVETSLIREVAELVDRASGSTEAQEQLDDIMRGLYSLRDDEAAIVGIKRK
jgi:N-6 DNA Methylase/TaqI-like C-terminal specificity domain